MYDVISQNIHDLLILKVKKKILNKKKNRLRTCKTSIYLYITTNMQYANSSQTKQKKNKNILIRFLHCIYLFIDDFFFIYLLT